MTVMEFFGCGLIAFGPPFSMFCLTICKDPIRIIILISAEAEAGLQKVSEVGVQNPVVTDRLTLSYVAGLGFGIMSGAFSLVNVLADAIGPGTVGLHGDSPYFFLASAFTTLAFILLHTFWGIIFFQALDMKNYILLAYVFFCHLSVSALTLFNKSQSYAASIPPIYIITLVTAGLAFKAAGGSFNNVKAACVSRRN
ncbi:gamma-secretase subunit Aph-1-like protein [Dinothrombium tinctorium]|uniref:Gamma-secretase subunit Aph-1-like protein n=1 Tax=Dinothrombium tinctorium TaxID=1965070 RepID=A0A3S3QZ47_9ACAR|nr:gamma-secretase subunit Aph-1-like protein [Dinothrombium tinctorium]